jgi:hypothetical protein
MDLIVQPNKSLERILGSSSFSAFAEDGHFLASLSSRRSAATTLSQTHQQQL